MHLLRSIVLLLTLGVLPLAAMAADAPAPEKVRALLQMLADPEVQG